MPIVRLARLPITSYASNHYSLSLHLAHEPFRALPMKNLVVIIGVILLLFAFAVMAVFIVIPAVLPSISDAPFIRDTLQTLLCKEGQTLTDKHRTFPQPGRPVTTITTSCVNNEGQSRDVTGQAILYGIVGYLVPFLTGLFMVIIGANRRRRYTMQSFSTLGGQGFSMNNLNYMDNLKMAGLDVNVDPDGKVTVKLPDGRVISGQQGMVSAFGNVNSLTDRLKELKSAYDAGLITQSEFEAKREEILKEM